MTDPRDVKPALPDMNTPTELPGFHGFKDETEYQRAKFEQAREIMARKDAVEHIIVEPTGRITSVNPYIGWPYGGGKTAAMAVAVTNNRMPGEPEGLFLDELADFGDLETRIIDSLSGLSDESIYKTVYGGPVGGSGKGDKGKTAKALAKRRKANKAARKARRK
jgi:hypothetical protein